MIKYCDYDPFQRIFDKLPQKDVEELKPALEVFFSRRDSICAEEVGGELVSVSKVNLFLKENFSQMRSLWEMENYGPPWFFVHELEHATTEVNLMCGFDSYGVPHVLYYLHEEFGEKFMDLPEKVRYRIIEEFWDNDLGEDELELIDDDGCLSSEQFVSWCGKNIPDLGDETSKQLHGLGRIMDEINRKVMANRMAAVERGEHETKKG